MGQGRAIKEKTGETPAKTALHMSEQDRADLERFRAAAAKLSAKQKGEVIRRMLARPDTP